MVVSTRNMSSNHQSPPTNRSIEKCLTDGAATGRLNLSNRKLDEFPRTAVTHDLFDTVEADVSKNRLTEFPKEICTYSQLERLDAYHNMIKTIPESIVNLQYVTFINLSRNQLSVLPEQICELEYLEVLHVSHNRLVSIPEEISEMTNLMELNAACNSLTCLPPTLGEVKNLKVLNVHRNLLVSLPCELAKLQLKKLDFSANRVQAIPLEFRQLESLEELVLENNPLITPPVQICDKGRVHIMKYLTNLSLKEERRRGLAENGFTRGNTMRRSYTRDSTDHDALRMRRRDVISVDSGYGADLQHRWTAFSQTPSSLADITSPSPEQLRERHLELSKRITQAELLSPPNKTSPSNTTGAVSKGNISPLQVGGTPTEDMFAKELQKQKQDYELKKKKAEQLRSETARKSSQLPTSVAQPNTTSQEGAGSQLGAGSQAGADSLVSGGAVTKPPIGGRQTERPMLYSERPNTLKIGPYRQRSLPTLSPSPNTEKGEKTPTPSIGRRTPDRSSTDSCQDKPPSSGSASARSSSASAPRRGTTRDAVSGLVNKKSMSGSAGSKTERKESSGSRTPQTGKSHLPTPRPVKQRSLTSPLPSSTLNSDKPLKADELKTSRLKAPRGHSSRPSSQSTNVSAGAVRKSLAPARKAEPKKTVEDKKYDIELREIMEARLKMPLPEDLASELKDGVLLCHLINHIKPRTVSQIHVKSAAVPKLTMAKSKRNVENFLEACKQLGVPQDRLCSMADILEEKKLSAIHHTVSALVSIKSAKASTSRPSTPGARSSPTLRSAAAGRRSTPLQSFV